MMKNFLFASTLVLLSNAASANTIDNVNELLSSAGRWSRNTEKFDVSFSLNQQAFVIAERVQDKTPLLLLRVLTQKMGLYIKSGQLDEAQKVCTQILAFKEKKPQMAGYSYSDFLSKYAQLLVLQGQLPEAEKLSLQAIEGFGKVSSEKIGTRLDEEFAFLGSIYMRQKEWDKAESYLRLAVFLNKEKRGSAVDNTYKKNATLDLIKVYQETKRGDMAKQVEADKQELLNPPAVIWKVALDPKYKGPTLVKESCKNPPFPPETTRYEMDGSMSLNFLIAEDGEVVGKYASRSSDWKRLDDLALETIAQCKFTVPTYEGRPTVGWAYYEYEWKTNPGGKPYPKPELIDASCKSDGFEVTLATGKPQDNDISFKINIDGEPHSMHSGNFKGNGNLYGELLDVLLQCRFKPTVIDGEVRGNKASMRFIRKQAADKEKVSLSQ